jgi:hypothetical protein
MNKEQLFCHTLDDIADVIANPTDYEVLRSSALLRQLLLDGGCLVDLVNRAHKLKVEFEISDGWATEYNKAILNLNPSILLVLDGLSPDTQLLKAPNAKLRKDDFLAYRLALINGTYISVRDIIDHCSNVMGGVHAGSPRSESQKAISSADFMRIGGGAISIKQLMPILRVVHKALDPLKVRVISSSTQT